MQLEHSFTVPVGVDEAWRVLLDIERVAPCMPGAALDSVDGDDFTGTVKVRVGPIGLTYKGKARFAEKDEAAHRAVIDAQGRDARGNGTAAAHVTTTLHAEGDVTRVAVVTDLNVTGKPAQFGRGVMADVGNKLIGQFADCLAGKLAGGGSAAAPPPGAGGSSHGSATTQPGPGSAPAGPGPGAVPIAGEAWGAAAAFAAEAGRPTTDGPIETARPAEITHPLEADGRPAPADDVEPINLIASAGPAIAKRVGPLMIAAVIVLLVLRRLLRR